MTEPSTYTTEALTLEQAIEALHRAADALGYVVASVSFDRKPDTELGEMA